MPIEDVFTITGRGTVVTGKVEQGKVHTGDEIEIVGLRTTQKTVCTGVEMFRKLLDEGQAGDNIGALLRGTKKEDVERGQVLCKPGSITPHTELRGSGVRPDQRRRVAGTSRSSTTTGRSSSSARPTSPARSSCPRAPRWSCPATTSPSSVELGKPIAMDEGLRFAIREGGRTVGAGRVTKITK